MNTKTIARITGGSIISMAILAGFAMSNTNSKTESSAALISWILIFLLDLIVSAGVFELFKHQQRKLALFSSWSRLLYSGILGLAIIALFQGSTDSFFDTWGKGLIIFGIHLFSLGLLFFQPSIWTRIIGVLMMVAGVGYFLIYLGPYLSDFFTAQKKLLEFLFMGPMILGELGFACWLLIRGGKIPISSPNVS
ncbi:MAG: DUF4386 domain-containing protein [Bacteroidetes bacterium]|nr:MAG: DUF4386 domain-containing protein [Bacteroidota bacterium]